MQMNGNVAVWGQTDFVPEAIGFKPRDDVTPEDVLAEARAAPEKISPDDAKEEKQSGEKAQKESYKPTEEAMAMLYFERMREQQEKAQESENGEADEQLRIFRVAHSIMRGDKVSSQDESFLLEKNYKLYMAAKNIAGMKQQSEKNIKKSLGLSKSSKKKTKIRKKFHYNFKEISAQIVNAKTSGNARQVLSKAALKTSMLRKKLKSSEYDTEAVQLALIHAEAMERVAKKKMKHLQEEEQAKNSGGVCAGDTEKEDRKEQKMLDRQAMLEAKNGFGTENAEPSVSGRPEEMIVVDSGEESLETLMADALATPVLDLSDSMEDLMLEMADLMEETLEEAGGLEELAEEVLGDVTPDIDPADLKEKKIKHRSEEQRKLAEADAKYLKALFQKLQREQQAVASGAAQLAEHMNSGGTVVLTSSSPAPTAKTAGAGAYGADTSHVEAAASLAAEAKTQGQPTIDVSVSDLVAATALPSEGAAVDVAV